MRLRTELEAEYLEAEARYRVLVEQSVVIERQMPGARTALRQELTQLAEQRREALQECNNILFQLKGATS